MTPPKDTRLQCRFCTVRTWSRNYKAFMLDHDRPDGRRCVKARTSLVSETDEERRMETRLDAKLEGDLR